MEQEQDEAEFLREALERYRDALDHEKANRDEMLDDFKFFAGEQWADDVKRERVDRPCLTINRLPQFVRQVTGDIRLNKPAINVRPVDTGADDKIAETYTGIIRNIESVSDADSAYILASEHAVTGGIGHFRVGTRYVSDDAWDQEITIKPVRNPFAVVWDPGAVELTREDARFCFVVDEIDRKAFAKQFPNSGIGGVDDPAPPDWQEWITRDTVRVAEYWVKKPVSRTLVRTPEGEVFDLTDASPDVMAEAMASGAQVRQVQGHKVCSYLLAANEVLAGPFEWPGKYIPVVPVVGSEINVGERVVRHGLVRFAKDAQKSYNYHSSADVEFAALQPKAPWLATAEQIKGYEADWARANYENQSVLRYNPDPQAGGPPSRIQPPVPSAAMGMLAMRAAEDMKAVTGIYDAALGARSNETSGRAILARQREGDVGTFHYVDNLAKAIAYCGRILVDLIPKIYDSERVVRTIGEDGAPDMARINVQLPDGTTANDISVGRYDVTVKAGPSFSSRRDESAQAMLEFMRVYPPAAGVIGDLVAEAMEWPGAKEIAHRLRASMPPGVVETAKAAAKGEPPPEPPPPPPPGPEQIEAQAKADKAVADAEKAKAEAAKAMMEVQGMHAGIVPLPGEIVPQAPPPMPMMQSQMAPDPMQPPPQMMQPQVPAVSIALGPETQAAIAQAQASGAMAMQEAAAGMGQAVQAIAQAAEMMAGTSQQVAAMGASVAEAARVMAAPRRVVRDAQGRATGVEAAI